MPGYVYRGNQPRKPEKNPHGRRKTGLAPFNPELCGTNPGYHQHYAHGQPRCEPCKAAHRAYDAEYRAKKRRANEDPRHQARVLEIQAD